tara:strand:+ start:342 stop:488 length:147 start_codon:yes stop_codon:yes gene_type:complete
VLNKARSHKIKVMNVVRRFTCELTGDKLMIVEGPDFQHYCMEDLDAQE